MVQTFWNTLNNLQSSLSQISPPLWEAPLFFQEKKVINPVSLKPSLPSSFILKGYTININ